MTGRFITFEGGEGAGKTTQLRLLAEALEARGRTVLMTREPGGSAGAEAIRALLVTGDTGRWDGMTEALLHYAARRDHLRCTILPALQAGAWVLCDRFNDSTIAYQGFGHGAARADLDTLYRLVAGDVKPDLTLILDLPVDVGLARAGVRNGAPAPAAEDRYERMGEAFHERLRHGFLSIAAAEPDRCAVIDASADPQAVHDAVLATTRGRLPEAWA
ncbi:MAG: dTMP kinase [Rhodospirillaceae bacterium]